ncbi:serine/threonine protein kinase [Inquilinus sp. KBS0705]|nr:serine/threonine protein kinase [Inquilinus sp. KBS0705]
MSKVFTITEGLENLGALRTGGQGSVYKGRRMGAILTAVKLLPTPIHSESLEDKNYRNFSNEVAKLQKVNEEPNPNVVKILSSGITESGSLPYIEMEYIEGPDLCELLQPPHEKIFMLQEVIRVAYQLASALAHCHKFGIKHGDVKSNNVKYNVNTGNYVLIDFGLAIMSEEERRSSMRHAGAIEFMAPEQHDGQMLLQTDVYSYGVILYELLTGQVPFLLSGNGDTGRNSVMLAHMEAPVPDLVAARKAAIPHSWTVTKQSIEAQVPQWLLQIVTTCLQKNPEDRYKSGIELHEAIISGSLSGDKQGQQGILLSENERLQNELTLQKQIDDEKDRQLATLRLFAKENGGKYNEAKGLYERNTSLMLLSKRAFVLVVMFAIIFMGLFCYSFFSKKDTDTAPNPGAIYPASAVFLKPPFIFKPYTYDSQADIVAAAEAKKLLAFKKKRSTTVKDTTTTKPVKKKRKKFLGIF